MEKNKKDLDNIELRSEKVRNVIGKVPPRLVSLGTVIITVIVLALAVAFYKIPYPISIETNGEVVNHRMVQVFVPYKYLYLFNEPRTAHVSFEGYDNISYQFDVASHSTKLVHKEDGNYFRAIGIMNTDVAYLLSNMSSINMLPQTYLTASFTDVETDTDFHVYIGNKVHKTLPKRE